MRMLLLKTWRDLLDRKGQFLGLSLVVALGISTFVAFQTGFLDLTRSVERANEELRFADFTTAITGASGDIVARVRRLPGVLDVEGRIVQDLPLEVGGDERATARLVSLPDHGRPRVNDLLLQAGRWPVSGRREALLHVKYAQETGVGMGASLVLSNGREHQHVHVVGIAASAEYMYAVPQKGALPSPREFAVLFLPHYDAGRILGRDGLVTDLAVRLSPGADVADAIAAVEAVVGRTRVVATVRRADQPSSFMLAEEIEQNRVMAAFLPAVILAISSSSLFIALSRLVTAQRREIGLEKALGYSDAQILAQYLAFAAAVALVGSLLGVGLGDLIARAVAAQYTSLLGVPFLEHRFHPEVAATAVAISAFACLLAGIAPAWRSARIAPAQAMHTDPGALVRGGRVGLLERLLAPLLPASFTVRIPLRNLVRQRRRSFYTVVGVAFAMLLSVTTQSMFDAMDAMIGRFRDVTERWDAQAVAARPFGPSRVSTVAHWPGVEGVQAAYLTAIEVRTARSRYQGTAYFVDPAADFHGFDIVEGGPAEQALAAGGLVLPQPVADRLAARVGSSVDLRTPGRERWTTIPVAAISRETLGAPLYANLEAGRRVSGLSGRFNVLYLDVQPWAEQEVKARLNDLDGTASVVVKSEAIARFTEMMEFTSFYQALLLGFGVALAFVVVYNTLTANVLERTREIATMRTIGESTGRLAWMVTIENLLLGLAAIPAGLWLGIRTAELLYAQLSSEAFTLTAVIKPTSVAIIVACLVVVLLLSEIPPVRRIVRLNLAQATKLVE